MAAELRILNPLRESPLDNISQGCSLDKPRQDGAVRWVPSRFTARSISPNGELILWNSYSGSINLFPAAQKEGILKIVSREGIISELKGIVKYLHERGFLVREGTDEFRRVQLAFGRQQYRTDILELILLASEDCNFRCIYCYEDFARGTMQPQVRVAIKRFVEKRAPELKSLGISWFGGEPLYGFKAIEELAPFFTDISEQYGLKFATHMTTNGYLLTSEVADQLLSWRIRDFQITLDGAPDQHDCRRKGRDGSRTFTTIFANLKSLQQRKDPFHVVLRINYDRETVLKLESFMEVLQAAFSGDSRFALAFHAVSKLGGPNDDGLAVCGLEDLRKASTLPMQALQKNLTVSTIAENAGVGAQVCYAARPYNFIVGASGKVMKCTVALDKQDYNVVGQLSHDGELIVDQDKLALWVEPAFERDHGCKKCQLLATCQGMLCPWVRIEEGKRPCPGYKSNLHSALDVIAASRANANRASMVGNK